MSAEIEFKLTSIAKADISSLLTGETLEVVKAYITNAQSNPDTSYVSGLSGDDVFNGSVNGDVFYEKNGVIYTKEEWAMQPAGTVPDSSFLHVEFFDDSENYYSGKTVAITYNKNLEERILCIATVESASEELVVKHFSPLSFSLDLTFDNADSISFDSINLSFPPATETSRGSVRIASISDVESGVGNGVIISQSLRDYGTAKSAGSISYVPESGSVIDIFSATSGTRIEPSGNTGTKDLGSVYAKFNNIYSNKFVGDLRGCLPSPAETGNNPIPVGTIFLGIVQLIDDNNVSFSSGHVFDSSDQYEYEQRVFEIYEAISCSDSSPVVGTFKKGRLLTDKQYEFTFLSGLETAYMDTNYYLVLLMRTR